MHSHVVGGVGSGRHFGLNCVADVDHVLSVGREDDDGWDVVASAALALLCHEILDALPNTGNDSLLRLGNVNQLLLCDQMLAGEQVLTGETVDEASEFVLVRVALELLAILLFRLHLLDSLLHLFLPLLSG